MTKEILMVITDRLWGVFLDEEESLNRLNTKLRSDRVVVEVIDVADEVLSRYEIRVDRLPADRDS